MTYNEFIQDIISSRGQWNIPNNNYYEKHHIIPKCMGGSNNKENIIWLYAREHFIAHKLLSEENPDVYGLAVAYFRMCTSSNGKYIIDENDYEEARKRMSDLSSEFMKGKTPWNKGLTKETDIRVAEYSKLDSTNNKGRIAWNKGLSKDTDNRVKSYSETLSKVQTGKILTNEHKSNISSSLRNSYKTGKRKSVGCILIETNEVFSSIREASEKLNITYSTLWACCKGKRETAGGYHWKCA